MSVELSVTDILLFLLLEERWRNLSSSSFNMVIYLSAVKIYNNFKSALIEMDDRPPVSPRHLSPARS